MSEEGRRKIDDIIPRMAQKLDDHIETFNRTRDVMQDWQSVHEEWCKTEIKRLEDDIRPFKKAFSDIERPIKWVGWLVTGTITGGLLYLGERIAVWIGKHWGS